MTAYMHPVVARGSSAVFEKLTIGKLASATGMKVETIRYYEQIGLLPAPTRSAANYRTYEQEHLRRLSFIRRARGLGFSIDQVRELMGLADRRDQSCIAVDVIANQHRYAIARKIADLTALAGELDALIDSCSRNTVADCRIIEALAPAV